MTCETDTHAPPRSTNQLTDSLRLAQSVRPQAQHTSRVDCFYSCCHRAPHRTAHRHAHIDIDSSCTKGLHARPCQPMRTLRAFFSDRRLT
mmetsp:Transcript_24156/g.61792  ORF Transcript_24156/g.61792 Transcript_24156/m.61792 type:complete len:90 (+) Transcript_24156:226-495(+)